MQATYIETQNVTFLDFKKQILEDYKLGRISREMSYLARREVLTGKAKFGIVGDGKNYLRLQWRKFLEMVISEVDITETKLLQWQ